LRHWNPINLPIAPAFFAILVGIFFIVLILRSASFL